GAGYIIIGRKLREKTSTITYISLVYTFAAVFLIFFMFLSGQQYLGFSGQTYIYFILLAIIPQLLGHSSFNWALGYLSAAFISITLLGEPIGSTILGYLVFSERPSLINLIGAILILTGIVVAFLTKNEPLENSGE
ncbi:MAG: DMT family transporter, partial [Candidatus Heimdallarchaeota archaeon]|nr:DMT family transporter [Candidatus Heimdallarchaeota archaeon]